MSNNDSWKECADYIANMWRALIEALQQLGTEGSGAIAPELAEEATKFWLLKKIFLTKFDLKEKSGAETQAVTIASQVSDRKEPVAIILTPNAMKSKKELVETLLHELLHSAGALSDDVEEDEVIAEVLSRDLVEKIMKHKIIEDLPEPPLCKAKETLTIGSEDKELQELLDKNINETIVVNIDTLADHLNEVTDPDNWISGLTEKFKKLNEKIDEILNLAEALSVVYNNKTIREIDDPELQERFKTILAGGIDPNKSNHDSALAPILWKLFGIIIKPARERSYRSTSNIEVIKKYKYKIDEVSIETNVGILKAAALKIREAIQAYLRTIESLDSNQVSNYSRNASKYIDYIKKYVPIPGDKPDELFNLIIEMLENIYEVLPGINPYVTFELAVSPVYLSDLIKILGIDTRNMNSNDLERLEKTIKLLGYNWIISTRLMADKGCGFASPEYLIKAIRSGAENCPIIDHADHFILIHSKIYDYDKGYSIEKVPWHIALVGAILSEEFKELEELILANSDIAPRKLAINYLLNCLKESLNRIDKLDRSKDLLCNPRLQGPSYDEYSILNEIPRNVLYSPCIILYYSHETTSVSYDGKKKVRYELCRLEIPGEEYVRSSSKVCRG